MLTKLSSIHSYHQGMEQGGGGQQHSSSWRQGKGNASQQEAFSSAAAEGDEGGTESGGQSGSESLWDVLLRTGMVSPPLPTGGGLRRSPPVGVWSNSSHSQTVSAGTGLPPSPSVVPTFLSSHSPQPTFPSSLDSGTHPPFSLSASSPPAHSHTTPFAFLSALCNKSSALTPAEAFALNNLLSAGRTHGMPTSSSPLEDILNRKATHPPPGVSAASSHLELNLSQRAAMSPPGFPAASPPLPVIPIEQTFSQRAATKRNGVTSVTHGGGSIPGAPAATHRAGVHSRVQWQHGDDSMALASLLQAGDGASQPGFGLGPWQGVGNLKSSPRSQSAEGQLLFKAWNSSMPPFGGQNATVEQRSNATVGHRNGGAVNSFSVGLHCNGETRNVSPESSRRHTFKGVRQRRWGKWVAEIKHPEQTRRVWLGTYDTAEEAVRAYNKAAVMYYGESVKLNPLPLEIQSQGGDGDTQPGPEEKAASPSKARALEDPLLASPRQLSSGGVPAVSLAFQNKQQLSALGFEAGPGDTEDHSGIYEFGVETSDLGLRSPNFGHIPRASSGTPIDLGPHSHSHYSLSQSVASPSIPHSDYHRQSSLIPNNVSWRFSLTEAEAFLLGLDN